MAETAEQRRTVVVRRSRQAGRAALVLAGVAAVFVCAVGPVQARVFIKSRQPYLGAIIVEAGTGRVLWEQNADAVGYPASCIKLMNLLLAVERMEAGTLRAAQPVTVTAEAAAIGGSQVYLKRGEVMPLHDLLCAMAIKSANDAATSVAITVGGSKQGCIDLMNQRAAELGMRSTCFTSVHGLPPSSGSRTDPDTSTARDLARLGCAVVKHPLALKYTAAKQGSLRGGAFQLRTHNYLLYSCPGCDGLKTGFFGAAGFSIVATAERNGQRLIAVVLGSRDRRTRDRIAQSLVEQGFGILATLPPPVAATGATNAAPTGVPDVAITDVTNAALTNVSLPEASAVEEDEDLPAAESPATAPDRQRIYRLVGLALVGLGLLIVALSLLSSSAKRRSNR